MTPGKCKPGQRRMLKEVNGVVHVLLSFFADYQDWTADVLIVDNYIIREDVPQHLVDMIVKDYCFLVFCFVA